MKHSESVCGSHVVVPYSMLVYEDEFLRYCLLTIAAELSRPMAHGQYLSCNLGTPVFEGYDSLCCPESKEPNR